jgi:nucleotide-binding universal stress UspA family protein
MTIAAERSVLAAVDVSTQGLSIDSQPTVDVAAAEAAVRGVPLRMVCAGPRSPTRGREESLSVDATLSIGEARRQVADAHPGLVVSAAVSAGDPASAVIQEARRAKLLVVGHPRATGPGPSVAASVATQVDCPVIVAPAGEGDGPLARGGPVVVGVKGVDRHASAVVFGLEEAALHDVPLQLVHVWSNIPDMELASVDPFVYDLAEARRDADRLIVAELDGWAQKFPEVTVQRIPLYRLDVATTLADAAAQASLLVLGPPRRVRSGRRSLGPIRYSLINNSRCPVALAS